MVVATVCVLRLRLEIGFGGRRRSQAGPSKRNSMPLLPSFCPACVRVRLLHFVRVAARARSIPAILLLLGRRIERQASSSVSRRSLVELLPRTCRLPPWCVAWCLFCPLCLAAARYKREELRGAQRKSRANPILASTPPPLLAPALRPTPGPSDTLDSLDSTRLRTRQRAQKASCLPFPTTTTNH